MLQLERCSTEDTQSIRHFGRGLAKYGRVARFGFLYKNGQSHFTMDNSDGEYGYMSISIKTLKEAIDRFEKNLESEERVGRLAKKIIIFDYEFEPGTPVYTNGYRHFLKAGPDQNIKMTLQSIDNHLVILEKDVI